LKFLKNGDYITRGSSIIDDEYHSRTNQLRWVEELICHNRLNSGNSKGYNGTSDEDSNENEYENEYEEERDEYEDEKDEYD
jgi:hypothetical protein